MMDHEQVQYKSIVLEHACQSLGFILWLTSQCSSYFPKSLNMLFLLKNFYIIKGIVTSTLPSVKAHKII